MWCELLLGTTSALYPHSPTAKSLLSADADTPWHCKALPLGSPNPDRTGTLPSTAAGGGKLPALQSCYYCLTLLRSTPAPSQLLKVEKHRTFSQVALNTLEPEEELQKQLISTHKSLPKQLRLSSAPEPVLKTRILHFTTWIALVRTWCLEAFSLES